MCFRACHSVFFSQINCSSCDDLHVWPLYDLYEPQPQSTQSFMEYLKNLASDITIVQGDFDEFPSPEHTVSGYWVGGVYQLKLLHRDTIMHVNYAKTMYYCPHIFPMLRYTFERSP